MNRAEREALLNGLTDIDTLVTKLNLTKNTQQQATELYRKATGVDGILSGRGVNMVVAACILLASRQTNDVVDADTIANHTADHVQAKTILRTSKTLRNELDIGFLLADPHKITEQLANDLNANDAITESTHTAIDIVLENGVASGKKSQTIAASCFYLTGLLASGGSGHGKYTQGEIADAANVTTVTIRNSYREFLDVIKETDGGLGAVTPSP